MFVLRPWKLLSVASIAMLAAMQAIEFFVFRPNAGGLPSLDFRVLGFTAEEARQWLSALAATDSLGKVIAWQYLGFDLVFPALFTATLASLLIAAGRRLPRFAAMGQGKQALAAFALALPYGVADYAQNIAVVVLLTNAQKVDDAEIALASALVVAKFALLAVPLIVIAVFWLKGQNRR